MNQAHMHCHAHMVVGSVYRSVVNDTIAAVRSQFLDEGVDEQVLNELKQLWETKLAQSRAVSSESDVSIGGGSSKLRSVQKPAPTAASNVNSSGNFHSQQHQQQQQQGGASGGASGGGATAGTGAAAASLVPIQITIPPANHGGDSKTIIVQVPVGAVQSGLAGQHLQTILSSPAAQATFALPADVASNVLQRQLNDALRQSPPAASAAPANTAVGGQLDGSSDTAEAVRRTADARVARRLAAARRKAGAQLVVQLDGVGDSSDSDVDVDDADDDDVHDDDDDDDDDVELPDDEDDEDGGQGREEEPLNSEDDVSDHEPADLQETFNVMVCQYDKITRSRNKWKFHLKDGIMNLDGRDYIFQRANGDAEW